MTCLETLYDQTKRSIWSLQNVIACISDESWNKEYCGMPLWKHAYHTIHSLDRWYINPKRYSEPDFHVENLNNLDVRTVKQLSHADIDNYLKAVSDKILDYLSALTEAALSEMPEGCNYTKVHLILAQHRHLDMHIGMMMGFIIADTGKWPEVMGLESELSEHHGDQWLE